MRKTELINQLVSGKNVFDIIKDFVITYLKVEKKISLPLFPKELQTFESVKQIEKIFADLAVSYKGFGRILALEMLKWNISQKRKKELADFLFG